MREQGEERGRCLQPNKMPWRERRREHRHLDRTQGNTKEFTVFVYNLPQILDSFGLKGVFQRAGKVSDSYTPFRRSRRTTTRYGFVRFRSQKEAVRSIHMLNNAVISKSKSRSQWQGTRSMGKSQEGEGSRAGQELHINNRKKVWKRKEQPSKSHSTLAKEDGLEAYCLVGAHHQSAIFHTWEPAMKLGDRADDALTRVAEIRVSNTLEGGKTPEDKLADVNDADSSVPAIDEIGIKTIGDEIRIVQETQNLNDIERIEESLDSPTKTKTACFSHNGSFHEVEQPRQQAIECERSVEINGAHQLEGGDGPEQPPGFEIQVNTNLLQKLERSEAKMEQSKSIESTKIRNTSRRSRATGSNRQSCSDSSGGPIQITKESLEVGKLVGLIVVDKEEAEIRRITRSLKKEIERKASKQQGLENRSDIHGKGSLACDISGVMTFVYVSLSSELGMSSADGGHGGRSSTCIYDAKQVDIVQLSKTRVGASFGAMDQGLCAISFIGENGRQHFCRKIVVTIDGEAGYRSKMGGYGFNQEKSRKGETIE
ncbi:hypothetical protein Cgig2_016556 [Carnegiea gigantea]|uniref:RRM domain-containing protein n=1 Tax=Carnegiea gigantea TaxID=171969 RepID=A0A9Q1KZL5_9CARY|nr:hypothetical protein Cgig2_016556 [Carnegiea gigantea]